MKRSKSFLVLNEDHPLLRFHFTKRFTFLARHRFTRTRNARRFDTKARHPRRRVRPTRAHRRRDPTETRAVVCREERRKNQQNHGEKHAALLDERDLRGKDGVVENTSSNVEKASTSSSGAESRPNAEETGGDGDHPPGVERGRKRGVPIREAIQRLCVRAFRSSSSLVYYAGVDIVSIFDEGERPKCIKSKSYPRRETISFLKP